MFSSTSVICSSTDFRSVMMRLRSSSISSFSSLSVLLCLAPQRLHLSSSSFCLLASSEVRNSCDLGSSFHRKLPSQYWQDQSQLHHGFLQVCASYPMFPQLSSPGVVTPDAVVDPSNMPIAPSIMSVFSNISHPCR